MATQDREFKTNAAPDIEPGSRGRACVLCLSKKPTAEPIRGYLQEDAVRTRRNYVRAGRTTGKPDRSLLDHPNYDSGHPSPPTRCDDKDPHRELQGSSMDVYKVDQRSSLERFNLEGPEATYFSRDWRHYARPNRPEKSINKKTNNGTNQKQHRPDQGPAEPAGGQAQAKTSGSRQHQHFGIASVAAQTFQKELAWTKRTKFGPNCEFWGLP